MLQAFSRLLYFIDILPKSITDEDLTVKVAVSSSMDDPSVNTSSPFYNCSESQSGDSLISFFACPLCAASCDS